MTRSTLPGLLHFFEAVPKEDRFVVENLDVFEDYDVLVRYQTLEALAALERQQPDT